MIFAVNMHLFYIALSSIIQPVKQIVNIVTRKLLRTASHNLKQYDSGD